MNLPCTCGHSVEEHPGRKECTECECIAYEPDPLECDHSRTGPREPGLGYKCLDCGYYC